MEGTEVIKKILDSTPMNSRHNDMVSGMHNKKLKYKHVHHQMTKSLVRILRTEHVIQPIC